MKRFLARAGVLLAVFIAAVAVFGILTNKGNKGAAASMPTPELPRLSFGCQGYVVNPLSGFTGDMDVSSVHGDILPLDASGVVTVYVTTYAKPIKSLTYEVLSLEGKSLLKGKIKVKEDPDQQLTAYEADLSEAFKEAGKDQQTTLVMKAKVKKKTVTYIMRLVMPDPTTTKACLDFAKNVHDQAMAGPTEGTTLETMLESADLADQTLDYVTIESDYDYVTWKGLEPQMVGNITWFIHEANSTSTSVSMRYQVVLGGIKNDDTIYTVDEFFRIRGSGKQMYLLDYVRQTDHLIENSKEIADESGLTLGITHDDKVTAMDKNGSNIAFVQNETVYEYCRKKNALIRIFGFQDDQTSSFYPDDNQRDINILKVEKSGDVIFTVAGYMPRGEHEGKIGLSLYQYDYGKNYVAEILFIPSELGYEVARDDLASCLCYGGEDATYYVVADGELSRLRIGAGSSSSHKVVERDITPERYAISHDASQIAYVDEDGDIRVQDLGRDEKYTVRAPRGEEIKPIGFIEGDLAYGLINPEDAGKMADGRKVNPIHKVILCNKKSKNLMTYEKKDVFMRDAWVQDGTITLERIQMSGKTYLDIADDYIQSNAAGKSGNIEQAYYTNDDGIELYRVTYQNGLTGKTPHYLTPKQSFATQNVPVKVSKNDYRNRYFVFGYGRAAGGYNLPGEAIVAADKLSGVVTEGAQYIYWERGNRDLIYDIPTIVPFRRKKGESAREACVRRMLQYADTDKSVDLSECTVEQVLYLIDHGKPITVLTQAGNALLLYGYSETSIHCINPGTGKKLNYSYKRIDNTARAKIAPDLRESAKEK